MSEPEVVTARHDQFVVGETHFNWVCTIAPQLEEGGSIGWLLPQGRYQNRRGLTLHQYGEGPFCSFRIPKNYRVSGVYIITSGSEMRYVGECLNLSARFNAGYGSISPRNPYSGGQMTNCRINNLIGRAASGGERVDLWFHQTQDYKALEAQMRAAVRYPWNRA